MACRIFNGATLQREEPHGAGSGWTTDDFTTSPGIAWAVRARFLVLGMGDSCTGSFSFEGRTNGGAWSEFAHQSIVQPGFSQWVEASYAIGSAVGIREARVKVTYDGDTHYTSTITGRVAFVAAATGVSAATAVASVTGQTVNAGIPAASADAAVTANEATAGLSSISLEASCG